MARRPPSGALETPIHGDLALIKVERGDRWGSLTDRMSARRLGPVHHADSFAMMRGGHLDICVLGAFQVSASGDLANWSTGAAGAIPAIGGAMDLAIGAKQTWVMMDLLTEHGRSKVVARRTYPLTGIGCVRRICTDLCTLGGGAREFVLIDAIDGLSGAELEAVIELPLALDG